MLEEWENSLLEKYDKPGAQHPCPICPLNKLKPAFKSKMKLHMKKHTLKAVPVRGLYSMVCFLPCFDGPTVDRYGHYHCPCGRILTRRATMMHHAHICKKDVPAEKLAVFGESLRPATIGDDECADISTEEAEAIAEVIDSQVFANNYYGNQKQPEYRYINQNSEVLEFHTRQEVDDFIRKYEQESQSTFVKVLCSRNWGDDILQKSEDWKPTHQTKIYWCKEKKDASAVSIRFDGIPYQYVGRKWLACEYGHAYNKNKKLSPAVKQRNVRPTKKVECPALITMAQIVKFPEYALTEDSRTHRSKMVSHLRLGLEVKPATVKHEIKYLVKIPKQSEHTNHPRRARGEPADTRILAKIGELIKQGITRVTEMHLELLNYVQLEFCQDYESPKEVARIFTPSMKNLLAIMKSLKQERAFSLSCQEKIEAFVREWSSQNPNDLVYFRYHTPEVLKRSKENTAGSLLFCYQSDWQNHLLARYGNHVVLLNPVHHHLPYRMPLYLIQVRTNVSYMVVGFFLLYNDNHASVSEALQVFQSWSPHWQPQCILADFNQHDIQALEETFCGATILISDYHRDKAWQTWTNAQENGCCEHQYQILEALQHIATAESLTSYSAALTALENAEQWMHVGKVREWLLQTWIPQIKRWAHIHRDEATHLNIMANNGLESMNEALRDDSMDSCKDLPIDGVIAFLVQSLLPQLGRRYVENNLKSLQSSQVDESQPSFQRDRPVEIRKLMDAKMSATLNKKSITQVEGACQTFAVDSEISPAYKYVVELGDSENLPSCTCEDWKRLRIPCKHMCCVLKHFPGISWENLGATYRDNPLFKIDETACTGDWSCCAALPMDGNNSGELDIACQAISHQETVWENSLDAATVGGVAAMETVAMDTCISPLPVAEPVETDATLLSTVICENKSEVCGKLLQKIADYVGRPQDYSQVCKYESLLQDFLNTLQSSSVTGSKFPNIRKRKGIVGSIAENVHKVPKRQSVVKDGDVLQTKSFSDENIQACAETTVAGTQTEDSFDTAVNEDNPYTRAHKDIPRLVANINEQISLLKSRVSSLQQLQLNNPPCQLALILAQAQLDGVQKEMQHINQMKFLPFPSPAAGGSGIVSPADFPKFMPPVADATHCLVSPSPASTNKVPSFRKTEPAAQPCGENIAYVKQSSPGRPGSSESQVRSVKKFPTVPVADGEKKVIPVRKTACLKCKKDNKPLGQTSSGQPVVCSNKADTVQQKGLSKPTLGDSKAMQMKASALSLSSPDKSTVVTVRDTAHVPNVAGTSSILPVGQSTTSQSVVSNSTVTTVMQSVVDQPLTTYSENKTILIKKTVKNETEVFRSNVLSAEKTTSGQLNSSENEVIFKVTAPGQPVACKSDISVVKISSSQPIACTSKAATAEAVISQPVALPSTSSGQPTKCIRRVIFAKHATPEQLVALSCNKTVTGTTVRQVVSSSEKAILTSTSAAAGSIQAVSPKKQASAKQGFTKIIIYSPSTTRPS